MPNTNKKKLLLVDDNMVNLKILTKILQDDYDIVTADNGELALDILNNAVVNSISAVILDIVMPVMDGYEVLRRMRQDKRIKQIPVIVASGQDSGDSDNKEILALSLGANDYLTKPYKPEIIKHRIANTIYLRETAAFVNTVQHDSLTGLNSKEYFYLRVEEILKQNPSVKYDMVCCDIERFKLVNDLYGTSVGDELLKCCANIFKDHVGKHGICGRIGPDIFAFFIQHQTKYYKQHFVEVIEKINSLHINLNIQLKYGIYIVDDSSIPANLLCDRAQLAIAAIKGMYGIYFKYYDNTIREKMVDEQYITSHMKKALENNEFEVYFQPKYDLKTETIIGAEALVRWNDPEKGFLSPGAFIPLFEKNGFITDLDQYIWESCCQKIRAWIDRGNVAIPISINVSRTDIYNPKIEQVFLSLLQKYSLIPNHLHLEITESAYTENSKQLIETIHRLKKTGFKIEMDDFGTGYSSLNMLSELPIDVVKLDIGFMQNQERYNNRSILSFIISLAKWMNLRIVAEGVETLEQANLLRSLGCDYAQGYYYARPMPVDRFEELLAIQLENYSGAKLIQSEINTHSQEMMFHASSIIIIDKTEQNYDMLSQLFLDEYKIINVISCEDASYILEQQQVGIALVLYDFNLLIPLDKIKNIISNCQMHKIPVMAILPSADDIDVVMNNGFTDYIVKPYHEIAIKNRIKSTIGNAQMSQLKVEHEINSAIAEMKKRAEQDSLTGLLNRAEFENKVQDFFCNNNRPSGYFIMLDVDNFKRVNDTYGHAVGDNALQAVASSLYDIFSETNIIGRMGGDEFALFIPYNENKENLENKVKMLCNSINFEIDSMSISCSVGICVSPENGEDFQSLYENADIALLHAKRNGKGQYHFYVNGMETPMDDRLEKQAILLLDNASDAMFVCDAVTSELIFINDTACRLIGKSKKSCLGSRCYQLFWERCKNCDRCYTVDKFTDYFYEENTVMKDGITKIHIKAKIDTWDGRRVKIHYLRLL